MLVLRRPSRALLLAAAFAIIIFLFLYNRRQPEGQHRYRNIVPTSQNLPDTKQSLQAPQKLGPDLSLPVQDPPRLQAPAALHADAPARPQSPSSPNAANRLPADAVANHPIIPPKPAVGKQDDAPPVLFGPRPGPGPGLQAQVRLHPNPHTIKSPDDFVEHFQALKHEKPMTVEQANSTCDWTADELREAFQFDQATSWVVNITSPHLVAELRREWVRFFETNLIPWAASSHLFKGRGIVYVGGNGDTKQRLLVSLRALRDLGSKLPVEIHHWAGEITVKDHKAFLDVYPDIRFMDLTDPSNIFHTTGPSPYYGHFNFKTAAMVNSRFAHILLLDTDNIPLVKPDGFFDSKQYLEYGTMFWPDIARTRGENPIWAIGNTPCYKDEYELESGQMLVDKTRFFYHLQLAAWTNEQTIYHAYILGDKDTFRFAWHALRTAYAIPPRWVTSIGFEYQGKYFGHHFAQHGPDGEVAFLHGGAFKTYKRHVIEYFRARGGIFNAYKRSDHDTNMSYIETNRLGLGFGQDFDGLSVKDKWWTVDFPFVPAKPLDELVPNLGQRFEDLGGFWMLNEPEIEEPEPTTTTSTSATPTFTPAPELLGLDIEELEMRSSS